MLTVIIPAHNEEALIGTCLSALFASEPLGMSAEVIVAANGCTDKTVEVAEGFRDKAVRTGWTLRLLDLSQGGKLGALNAADVSALGNLRVYLDADVTVEPGLMAALVRVLDRDAPAYASGQLNIVGGPDWVSRAYAALWRQVPFMTHGVQGCGLFAVNAAGRARWQDWPDIISDDTFARLNFAPSERHMVEAGYDWPIARGFPALVRVRRRQDRGVIQLREHYPHLMRNDDTPGLGLTGYLRLALSSPLSFAVYTSVALATKLRPQGSEWSRGR